MLITPSTIDRLNELVPCAGDVLQQKLSGGKNSDTVIRETRDQFSRLADQIGSAGDRAMFAGIELDNATQS